MTIQNNRFAVWYTFDPDTRIMSPSFLANPHGSDIAPASVPFKPSDVAAFAKNPSGGRHHAPRPFFVGSIRTIHQPVAREFEIYGRRNGPTAQIRCRFVEEIAMSFYGSR